MAENKKTKFKWLTSYQKECRWLEQQAAEGWFLENISAGSFYTFRKGEPRRMLYEVDRFNLPQKPTLEQIRHKELFMEMAEEMGWREVTHDEGLNYYFCREYEEGGINELYNDEQSRRYRAQKFESYIREATKKMAFWSMIVAGVNILVRLMQFILPEEKRSVLVWYDWFTLIYVVGCCGTALYFWKQAEKNQKELSMTRKEWEEAMDPATHKTVKKLVLTARGLSGLLKKEAAGGWTLQSVTPTKYFFVKSEAAQQVYTMDTKWLTNRRMEEAHREKIRDGKDWYGKNNDWQLQSVKEAEEKGWEFVCALENRTIIYRGDAEHVQALNDARYDHSLRFISLIGEYGICLLICGLIGGIIGFLVGFFSLL